MSSNKDDEPKMILVNRLNPMGEYIPFGKYLLSLKQLQKNRFMIRTKSKNPVLSFRTITLSRKTKNIIQKLLQDIDISFEEIDSLNEDKKKILTRLSVLRVSIIDSKYPIQNGLNSKKIYTNLMF